MTFTAFIVLPAIKGDRTTENNVYLTREDWLEANWLAIRELEKLTAVGPVKQHAKELLGRLNAGHFCEPEADRLRALCLSHTERHGHERRPQTLFHKNGKTATGTYQELVIATGLDYNRVRDLLMGRDRYCLGWAASAEEAAKGRLKSGRKPKIKAILFESEGTPLF
jgi:hypothetical protein